MKKSIKTVWAVLAVLLIGCLFGACPTEPPVTTGPDETETTYDVTVNASGGGTVTADPQTAKAGDTVTLSFDFDEDALVLLSVDLEDADGNVVAYDAQNCTFVMPESDVTVTVVFIPKKDPHAINLLTAENGALQSSHEEAQEGFEVTITLIPATDCVYIEDSLVVTKESGGIVAYSAKGDTGLVFAFTMPDEAVSVEAQFTIDPSLLYNITRDMPEEGAIIALAAKAQAEDIVSIQLEMEFAWRYTEDSIKVYKSEDAAETALELTPDADIPLKWTFEMPAEDVTVYADWTAIPAYIVSADMSTVANGSLVLDPSGKQLGGTEITATLTIADTTNYEYKGGFEVLIDGVVFSAVTQQGTDLVWTFELPEEPNEDIEVSVSAIVDFIPAFNITLPTVTAGMGSISASPLVSGGTTARQGWDITVTITLSDAEEYRVKAGTFDVYTASGPLGTQDGLKWTFTMPSEDVTVEAELELIPGFHLTVTPSANGPYTLSNYLTVVSPDVYDARAGRTMKISMAPGIGYKAAVPSVTPAGAVSFTKVAGENAWNFVMAEEPVTVGINCPALGLLEIYKGGARNGISVADEAVNNIGAAYWYENYGAVELNSDLPGHDGNLRAIKISSVPNDLGTGPRDCSFMLVSDTAINLSSAAALSFWARTSSGNLNASYAGFGTNGTNLLLRVVYNGAANTQSSIQFNDSWQRFIIPIPITTMSVMNPIILRTQIPLGNELYIDDVEFITSGLSLKEIDLRTDDRAPFLNSNAANYVIPDIPASLPFDATVVIQNRGFVLRYELAEDGSIWALHSEPQGNNWKFDLRGMVMPLFTYALSGSGNNGTISSSGNISPDGTISGSLNFTVSMNGVTSNPVTIKYLPGALHAVNIATVPGGTITVAPALYSGQAPATSTVTVTLQEANNYAYDAGSINVYRTAGGTGDTVPLTAAGNLQWTFVMPDEDVSITAKFNVDYGPVYILEDFSEGAGAANGLNNYSNLGFWATGGMVNGGTSTGLVSNAGQARGGVVGSLTLQPARNATVGLAGRYFAEELDITQYNKLSFWLRHNNQGGNEANLVNLDFEWEFLLNIGGTYVLGTTNAVANTGTFFAGDVLSIDGVPASGSIFKVPQYNNNNTTGWTEIIIDLTSIKSQPGFDQTQVKGWAFRAVNKEIITVDADRPRVLVDDMVISTN